MRYAYYPGCSLKATAIDFNLSNSSRSLWGSNLWK
jgi:hypothetical protein